MKRKKIVITGLGAVAPNGNNVDEFWTSLTSGRSGIGPITYFDPSGHRAKIAGELSGFEPESVLDPKEIRKLDPFSVYALVATNEAVTMAGINPETLNLDRVGVTIGTGVGGIQTLENQHSTIENRGARRVSPQFVPKMIANIAGGHLSIRWGFQGPNQTVTSACASATDAIGLAMRLIISGDADMMIAVGGEETITPMTYAGFSSMKALSTRNEDPAGASRPFSADRDGFVMGEGAGALVLEALECAEARGAEILAELVGYGLSADAYHITAPPPDGYGAQYAMQMALEKAEASPDDVDYVNAHGTSTMADAIETTAIKEVLGERAYEIVVGSTKSMTGHLLGATGALETIVSILVCRTGKIPPTINFQTADPECDLEYAHGGVIERPVRLALSNSFGVGGHNVCLAIRGWD